MQYNGEPISSVDINAHGFFAVIMVSHFCYPARATFGSKFGPLHAAAASFWFGFNRGG